MKSDIRPDLSSDRNRRQTAPAAALRLGRALSTHFEGLILFAIAVVVVSLSGTSGTLTAACAWVYLAARVLYIPAYAFAWSPGRSLIWAVGLLATVIMLLAALI